MRIGFFMGRIDLRRSADPQPEADRRRCRTPPASRRAAGMFYVLCTSSLTRDNDEYVMYCHYPHNHKKYETSAPTLDKLFENLVSHQQIDP